MMTFSMRLSESVRNKNSCLMLGLDPNWEKMPSHLKSGVSTEEEKVAVHQKFCEDLIDATADYVCGVKIQMAYFETEICENYHSFKRFSSVFIVFSWS